MQSTSVSHRLQRLAQIHFALRQLIIINVVLFPTKSAQDCGHRRILVLDAFPTLMPSQLLEVNPAPPFLKNGATAFLHLATFTTVHERQYTSR